MYKNIQLKITDKNGIVQLAYPVVKPEFVEFDDGNSLIDKFNNIGNTHDHEIATTSKDGFLSKTDKQKIDKINGIENSLTIVEERISSVESSMNNVSSVYYEEVIG